MLSHSYSLSIRFKTNFDIGVFFSENLWIKNMARPEHEGHKNLMEKLKYLHANKHWGWIPYALVDIMIRFMGYRLGLLEKNIPRSIKKRLSNNEFYWEPEVDL